MAGKWGLEQFSATVDAKERVESPPYTLGTEKNEAVVLFLLLKSVSDSGWWIFAKYDSDILKKSFFPPLLSFPILFLLLHVFFPKKGNYEKQLH